MITAFDVKVEQCLINRIRHAAERAFDFDDLARYYLWED